MGHLWIVNYEACCHNHGWNCIFGVAFDDLYQNKIFRMNFLLILSNALVVLAYLIYIQAILAGKARPHRTTRLTIFIIVILSAITLFAQGNLTAFWLAGLSSVFCLIILLLTIRRGMGGWDRIDIASLIIAGAGIIIWQMTNNPVLGLYASILADFAGVFPTIIKTYHQPKTETWKFFFLGGSAALLNLGAQEVKTFANIVYPLYLFLVNYLLVAIILKRK
jgi:hypothetical protein